MNDLEEKRLLYPRVTEIIGKQNEAEMRAIPLEMLANATLRGTAVHQYCAAWLKKLWIPEVRPEYAPYFSAFTDWASSHIEAVLHTDQRLYDDSMRFSGEFDMIVQIGGKKILLDLKTSSAPSKTWPLQLSAYAHLCKLNGYEFDECWILHLKKDYRKREEVEALPSIRANVVTYQDLSSFWDIFSSSLTCYDYFHRKDVK